MLTPQEITALGKQPTNAAIAAIWNLYFDSPITGWDLDFSVSRNWVRSHPIQRKTVLTECWHNPEGELAYFLRFLSERMGKGWAFWAESAAILAVLGAELAKNAADSFGNPEEKTDIACVSGSFSGVLAGLYLKRMGFPVGKLVCCCNENNSVWELVHLGTLRTDPVGIPTLTPKADTVLPEGLEHFLFLLGGTRQALEYRKASYIGETFSPTEELLKSLRQHLFVSVVGESRMTFTAAGVIRTAKRLVSPYDALCIAGVQDYRAKTGENRPCLLLSQWAPDLEVKTLANILGVPEQELRQDLGR